MIDQSRILLCILALPEESFRELTCTCDVIHLPDTLMLPRLYLLYLLLW